MNLCLFFSSINQTKVVLNWINFELIIIENYKLYILSFKIYL